MNEQDMVATRRWFTEGWTGAVELRRFSDGRVTEIWTLQDQLGLLQQVGLVDPNLHTAQVPAGVA